jgi:23S rRNA pseudouridine1911/1915/1917 synthase
VDELRDDSSTGATGTPGTPGTPGGAAGELTVSTAAAGERLDRFIATHLGSRAAAERAVEAGVLVDGRPRPKSYRLEGGERVQLAGPVEAPRAAPPPPPAIVFQDEHLAVVDKPAGLVVHAGAGHAGDTLVDALADLVGGGEPDRPGIVHRLDRDTSGLLVVARSDEAHDRLTDLVRRRGLDRAYIALVRGRPASRSGRIEAAIGRDRDDPTRVSLDTDTPRDAVTHFEVERLLAAHALLRVRLETGRMHQIRVHLAAIDLPVVGDPVYGVPDPTLGRQFLHAARLAFVHPFTGERLELESPLPADLGTYLSGLAPLP